MNQEDTAYKIAIVMMDIEMVSRNYHRELQEFLCQAYAAGWDEGRKQTSHRIPVTLTDRYGNSKEYDSITIAARAIGVTKSTMAKAAKGKYKTSKGYKCNYKDKDG